MFIVPTFTSHLEYITKVIHEEMRETGSSQATQKHIWGEEGKKTEGFLNWWYLIKQGSLHSRPINMQQIETLGRTMRMDTNFTNTMIWGGRTQKAFVRFVIYLHFGDVI